MKKKFSILASLLLLVSMFPMSVFAEPTYTPISGGTVTFNKYLIMDAGDTVPAATFAFSVSAGSPISEDTSNNTVMEVLAGPVPSGSTITGSVTFGPSDTTYNSIQTGDTDVSRTQQDRTGTVGTDTVQFDSGEKYAKKNVSLDFSGVSFPEPGIYRYIITETTSSGNGLVVDSDIDRVLDVYVVNREAQSAVAPTEWYYDNQTYTSEADAKAAVEADQTGPDYDYSGITNNGTEAVAAGLEIAECLLHTNVSTIPIGTSMGSNPSSELEDKTDGFTNEYQAKDLRISKEVEGNQASKNKYFALTVTCTGVQSDANYTVSLTDDNIEGTNDGNADATSGEETPGGTIAANAGKTNPTTVLGSVLASGQTFYLKDGQNVVIRGLAPNVTYYVTENEEDYQSSVMTGKTNGTVSAPATIGTVADANTANTKIAEAGFTNTRNGIIPTGVITMIAFGIGITVIAILGIFMLYVKQKKRTKI